MLRRAILLLICASAYDFIWVTWISAVAAHQLLLAPALSMILGVMSLYSVTEALKDKRLAAVSIIGLGIGTTAAMLVGVM